MARPSALLLTAATLLLALASLLRFGGIDYLLPLVIEPDAHIPVQVRLMEEGLEHPEQDRDYGKYPHLVAWTTRALTPRREWGSVAPASGLEDHLELATYAVLRVRIAVALLSLLVLPATWFLARLYLSNPFALLATGLVATSLLALHFGTEARPHGAAVSFSTLAVAGCVWLARRRDVPATLIAGLFVALAVGSLQSGVATLIPLGVAHLIATRGHGWRGQWKLFLMLPLVAASVLIFYPFLFAESVGHDVAQVELSGGVLNQSGHKLFLSLFNGGGVPVLLRALWSWEPALFLGSGLGLIVFVIDRLCRTRGTMGTSCEYWVILSYVVPYAFVILLYERSYERFLLPLVPFLAILTSWSISRVGTLRAGVGGRALSLGLSTLVLGFPTLVGLKLVSIRRAPSTIELAARFVEECVEDSSTEVVLTRPLCLPLFKSKALAKKGSKVRPDRGVGWISYQRDVLGETCPEPSYDLTWIPYRYVAILDKEGGRGAELIDSLSGRFCIMEVFVENRITKGLTRLCRAMRANRERILRISPDGDPDSSGAPLHYQDDVLVTLPLFAWRVLHAERMGPVLEVYRLDEGP